MSFSSSDSNVFLTPGVAFARYLLIGCWKNLIDTLSTPLTGRMAGSSKGLAFILGAEGAKEQNQKEKDSICLSLDGLRRAARLSCALGTAVFYVVVAHSQNRTITLLFYMNLEEKAVFFSSLG